VADEKKSVKKFINIEKSSLFSSTFTTRAGCLNCAINQIG